MATRRSSTSAIERIRKHDRRTFETPLPNSGHSAFAELPISQAGPTRGMGRRVNGVVPPRGSRGFTGQGPLLRVGSLARRPLRLPPATIARDESFAPTRSTLGHLLSRHPIVPRLESPWDISNGPANLRKISWIRPRVPTFVDPRDEHALSRASDEGRLPHLFAKRRCVPLHPRCLPSKDPLSGGALFHSLSPTCGVEPAPFQSSRLTAHGRCDGGATTRPSPPRWIVTSGRATHSEERMT